MAETTLYIEKDTDLMRSTFVACGVAMLLNRLPQAGSNSQVRIQDKGSAYVVTSTLSPDALRKCAQDDGLPPILPAIHKPLSKKELERVEAGESLESVQRRYVPQQFNGIKVDYGAEKDKPTYIQSTKEENRQEGRTNVRGINFPVWAHLCSYFGKGSAMRTGYPLVLHAWHAHQGEQAVALLDLIFACYGEFPTDYDGAQAHWLAHIKPALEYDDFTMFKWEKAKDANVSALSIVSPTTAQGSFTDSAARQINTNTPNIFWLELFFALVGYIEVGMPFRAGSDALLYYPLIKDIRFTRLRRIMSNYRESKDAQHLYDQSNYLPRIKTDALAQINFYKTITEHFVKAEKRPQRINAISGLVGYFYKDISTQIPFDETVFALPSFIPKDADLDTLKIALDVLEEHRKIVQAIRGEYSDELVILQYYRHYITMGNPKDFIDFAIAYGSHRFKKMVDAPWLPFLTHSVLEKSIMMQDQKDYLPILNDAGFQNIAEAINASTVTLRYFKDVKKQSTAFKVRYGLGDDLRRRSHNADHFIEDLSTFVTSYMEESSNVQARTNETRHYITLDDLNSVVALIPQYGAQVVANLLVAAGYTARYDRKKQDSN